MQNEQFKKKKVYFVKEIPLSPETSTRNDWLYDDKFPRTITYGIEISAQLLSNFFFFINSIKKDKIPQIKRKK